MKCRVAPLSLFVALLLLVACVIEDDGSELGSGSSTGGDGKQHPPSNGVQISETEACEIVQSAFWEQYTKLSCGFTVRPCPGFLRVQYDPDCMLYDQGTVQGCAAYYKSLHNCAALVPENCVLVGYPGTEPAGCP